MATEAFMPVLDPFACTQEEALSRIRAAGITGMGGAGFPTHIKLKPPKPVDTMIADGAECEPYLTTDEASLHERTALVIQGLAISMHITGVKQGWIGMEDNKAWLIPHLEDEIRRFKAENPGFKGEVGIQLCKTRYPQGGEKMLITTITGRQVPSGGLPADAGCIVQNVGTLAAIAEAFYQGKPLIDRDLTLSGDACFNPKNTRVPVGTLLSDLTQMKDESGKDFLSIDNENLGKIIFGGPMMGTAVPNLDIPIQKNTSGVLFMTKMRFSCYFPQCIKHYPVKRWSSAPLGVYRDHNSSEAGEEACIKCGRCVRNCPMKLQPVQMNDALLAGDLDEAVHYGLRDCIECGSCSYMCPAHILLTQRFRVGKLGLRNRMVK
jgi:electron transport complex protein RnfC